LLAYLPLPVSGGKYTTPFHSHKQFSEKKSSIYPNF